MARALLLALTCVAAASAARYVDYSGVKMPAYGGGDYEAPREVAAAPPSEDYHGHSPDAPASLDYKYEEEPRVKTEKPTKDADEPEVWRKPGRKQRGLMRPMESSNVDVAKKYERDEEEVPKFRSSHRYPKHRSRLKSDVLLRDEESPPRRPIKYSRDRKDDVSDIDRKDYFHIDKDDFPDDKSKEFDDDVKFMNEAITRRVSRRKPRDRHLKRKSDVDVNEDDLEQADRRLKMEFEKEAESRRVRPLESRGRYRPQLDEDDEDPTKVQPLSKPKETTYEDYDDYYDMKRVYSIKNKLPSLLRRTTVWVSPPTPTSLLQLLWTNRRTLDPPSSNDRPDSTPATSSSSSSTSTTTSTTTVTTTTTTATTTILTTSATARVSVPELSLAEKSRLSIMKKDQRKEGQHIEPPTNKPPVLLQVTRHLPTVVMVEPPSSMMPWMRARELSEDSPDRIVKVKKLMRHKLVAEARSIHDLTDKWDDMVCDYIDVALLDSGAAMLRTRRAAAAFALLPCAMWLYYNQCFMFDS